MKFADIPGLEPVKKILREAVSGNHIAHAQLFLGIDGSLNLPLAIAFTTYLHCENRGEDACGVCAACSKSLKYIHPDTHFVLPISNVKGDKDEDRFKADILKAWRSFLLENPFGSLNDWINYFGGEDKQALISREESREIIKTLSLKPFESKFKVMIIWQPELMHPSAANGILKILEEPPANTFFFLVTNAADRLLPTIISRTQLITVPLPEQEIVRDYLEQAYALEPTRAHRIAMLADGNLALARTLMDKEEDEHAPAFTRWMRACFRRQYTELFSIAEEFHTLDKLSQRNRLIYSLSQMRETLLHLHGAGAISKLRPEEAKFIQDFGKVMDLKKIDAASTLLNEATFHLDRNGSAKMVFLNLSLNLSRHLNPVQA